MSKTSTEDLLKEGLPTTGQISKELKRVRYNTGFSGMLRSTVGILVTVAAVAVLIAVLLLPVLQIYGTSMTPTLNEGDGQWVDIDKDGNVFVDNIKLDEPYIVEKSFGETNIKLPYQVPDSRIFVLGDNRDVSIDSRHTSVGCISDEQIVGKIIFRIWPFRGIGWVK